MNSSRSVTAILDDLINLLTCANETNWCAAFETFKQQCQSVEAVEDEQSLHKRILQIYGGMGSFSDLVLYDGHKVLVSENTQLDDLRRELFNRLS